MQNDVKLGDAISASNTTISKPSFGLREFELLGEHLLYFDSRGSESRNEARQEEYTQYWK
jgi:hypothetical protein